MTFSLSSKYFLTIWKIKFGRGEKKKSEKKAPGDLPNSQSYSGDEDVIACKTLSNYDNDNHRI